LIESGLLGAESERRDVREKSNNAQEEKKPTTICAHHLLLSIIPDSGFELQRNLLE
jgi:hypothetical protein